MTYKEYKETTTQEINQFVDANCIWAFGREQLAEALKEHNLTEEEFQNNYCGFFGGGAIRKDKIKEYEKICEKQNNQLQELMKDERFAYEALYYELANHEYGYTGNESDALRDLGLTADDIIANQVLNRAFCRAAREIKNQDL
jgi:hypothetical protein